MDTGIRMRHLGLLVTTYCNLNCRNCADLIPKREGTIYRFNELQKDVEKLLKTVEYIDEVLVIGGETLLYSELEEVLDYCASIPKIGRIIITTNGTIQPKDNIIQCLKRNNVLVRVSGYPEFVAPRRNEIIQNYLSCNIEVENLENMIWFSMGGNEARNRTQEKLEEVFASCAMRNCVSMNAEGKIFYCSHQIAAWEGEKAIKPLESEYIDVRNSESLKQDLERFSSLKYITTCNYCDGVSCATTEIVPTAVQIMEKMPFLDLLSYYVEATQKTLNVEEKLLVIRNICRIFEKNLEILFSLKDARFLLNVVSEVTSENIEEKWNLALYALENLVNALSSDYNYKVSANIPYAKRKQINNKPNIISIGKYDTDDNADILLSDEDIWQAIYKRYPIDLFYYNRLFIISKLERLKVEDVTCIVSGLSYTQYGFLEKRMKCNAVNLSITGQDVPYSIMLAEKAIQINPNVKYIIMPMTYYQGCYDMTNDEFELHHNVVSKCELPILKKPRNFNFANFKAENEGKVQKIYDIILDMEAARRDRDLHLIEMLKNEEFFSSMNSRNEFGSLKFDYRLLGRDEKFKSAKITAEHNERICNVEGYHEVKMYLENFVEQIEKTGRKLIVFVPPMTEYLYAGYHDELRTFFYQRIVPMLERKKHVQFWDFANDKRFDENDFADFEHLSESGAVKLTDILNELVQNTV